MGQEKRRKKIKQRKKQRGGKQEYTEKENSETHLSPFRTKKTGTSKRKTL